MGDYNAGNHRLVINGILMDGVMEDGVTNEAAQPRAEKKFNLDGKTTYEHSRVNERTFTIAFDPTKQGYKNMGDLAKAADDAINAGLLYPKYPFEWTDPLNGTSCSAPECRIMNRPLSQGQKAMAPVVYEVSVPNPTEVHAANAS